MLNPSTAPIPNTSSAKRSHRFQNPHGSNQIHYNREAGKIS